MWVAPSMVEIQIHGPSLRMSNCIATNRKKLTTFKYEDLSCSDKNEKLLANKPSILFSQHSNFGNKIKKIVRMMKRWATRKSFVCSLVEFTHTRNKCT
jgi:hypothetical protein